MTRRYGTAYESYFRGSDHDFLDAFTHCPKRGRKNKNTHELTTHLSLTDCSYLETQMTGRYGTANEYHFRGSRYDILESIPTLAKAAGETTKTHMDST